MHKVVKQLIMYDLLLRNEVKLFAGCLLVFAGCSLVFGSCSFLFARCWLLFARCSLLVIKLSTNGLFFFSVHSASII